MVVDFDMTACIRMLRVLMRELCSLVLIHGCTTFVRRRQYVDCKMLCNGFANKYNGPGVFVHMRLYIRF